MSSTLAGTVALVTGASSGIGAATARRLDTGGGASAVYAGAGLADRSAVKPGLTLR